MYSAIYRDFRPDRFDQIIGQDHIVKILKNQIASGQTGPCLPVLRNQRNRQNDDGPDSGKGAQL